MTTPRQVIPGRTYLISRRCAQRQFLLRPDPEVVDLYRYCLAEAAARFDVTVIAFVSMSNHQHLIIRDNHGNYPGFLAHLHKMIAKAMNARLGRWENFWATEQPNAVYLVDAADRFAKLIYLLANPVASDAVDRVADWPGASSFALHVSNRRVRIRRPRGYFRPNGKMPNEVTLHIERPEGFEHLSDVQWSSMVQRAIRAAEERARDERQKRGVRVLGRKAVLTASPTTIPTTVEPRRNLRPRLACLDRWRRVSKLQALANFLRERRRALVRFLVGEHDVEFPFGTYHVYGAPVARRT